MSLPLSLVMFAGDDTSVGGTGDISTIYASSSYFFR